jgi:hypothetical protein
MSVPTISFLASLSFAVKHNQLYSANIQLLVDHLQNELMFHSLYRKMAQKHHDNYNLKLAQLQ